MRRASIALGMIALASVAMGQSQSTQAGVSANAYFLTQKKMRDVFGDPALTYGLNLSGLTRPQANRPTLAYNPIAASKGDSRFFLLPLTIGYEIQLTDRNSNMVPYGRIEGGYAYYDVAIHDSGIDQSFKAGGFVAAVEAGLVMNKSIGLKARYNLFQDRFGVNLSGLELGLVYNFASF
jgi:hypothetical protein